MDAAGNESAPATAYARTKKRGCSTAAAGKSAPAGALGLFPNPVSEWLAVRSPELGLSELRLVAADGRRVLRQSYPSPVTALEVDVRHLPEGLYLLSATDAIGGVRTDKVVVKR